MRDPVWFNSLLRMMPRIKAEEGLFQLMIQHSGDLRELSNWLTAASQGLTNDEYREAKNRAMRAAAEAQAALEMLRQKRK